MNRTLTSTAALSLLCLTVAGCSSSDTPAAKPQATSSSTASTGTIVPLPNATSSKGTASVSPSVDCSDTSLDMAEWTANCAGDASDSPTVDAEGSVTDPDEATVQWPNGLQASVVKVETDDAMGQLAAENSSEHPDFDGGLHVTVKFENAGTETVQLNKMYDGIVDSLVYGQNRYDAEEYASTDTLPSQLVPGTSAEQTWDYTLPRSEYRDALRLTVTPDSGTFTEFTFTDVETLISK